VCGRGCWGEEAVRVELGWTLGERRVCGGDVDVSVCE